MTKPRSLLWLVVMGVTALVVYWPGLNASYFLDDYQFVFDEPSSKVFWYFAHPNDQSGFYRPIQASFLAIVQTCFGMQCWPIRLTQIALHVLLAWLVYVMIVTFGFSRLQAGIGAVFMLLSQANAMAVLSNDTLSQLGGTLFGCLALWFLYRFYHRATDGPSPLGQQKRIDCKYYVTSLAMLVLSLFSKETSVSFLPMAAVVALLANLRITRSSLAVKKAIVDLLPYALAAGVYLAARSVIVGSQPTFGSGRYNFHVGVNIIRNLVMSGFALFVPVSTVTVFSWFKSGALVVLGVIGILTLAFFVLVALGLWYTNRPGVTFLMAGLALLGLFPTALLNHVSELYIYNSMPFVAVLVGIGLGQLWLLLRAKRAGHAFLMLMVCALMVSHIVAVRSKAQLMDYNGQRAAALLQQVNSFADNAPLNGHLWLCNPPVKSMEYSVFCVSGFNVLHFALSIPHLWNRTDLEMRIVSPADMAGTSLPEDTLVLTLEGDDVVVLCER